LARNGKAWKGMARQGMELHVMEWNGKERQGKARHGMTWKGKAWKFENTSLDGKEICDIKLSHMSLENFILFFISWDDKCSFFLLLFH
jgi:hypothetical protein